MGEKPQKIQEQKQISLGVLAHVDAGKTTLSEGLLFKCGRIRKIGRVDHKDAYLDTYELERERGITIFSKQAVFSMGAFNVTLLDTPGHVDFSAEMERTLQVLDYAILVINGADGVQGHTQTLWRLLEQYKIPTFLFVNKMDQDGTDREGQWEYNNNGKFKMFIDDDIDWIDKKAIANKKMDISMVDLNEYLKYRKCTIAVIDSGINIENAILKRHLWKNTDEKIDNIDNDANGYVDIILKITTLNCFLGRIQVMVQV